MRQRIKTATVRHFVDRRGRTELLISGALLLVFLLGTTADNFPETFSKGRRAALYGSLAGTSGALLGFVLAAFSILVALPDSERVQALRSHPKWDLVPSAYFRAARALLLALILCTLGIALDSAKSAWKLYEAATVGALGVCLARVIAAVVALDMIVGVAGQTKRLGAIKDP